MTDQELLDAFTRILCEVVGDDSIALGMETTRGTVPNWDSVNYVTFIVAVEVELGVKFRIGDVESFETVGDIVKGAQALLRTAG
jgi:acyl carrier protein